MVLRYEQKIYIYINGNRTEEKLILSEAFDYFDNLEVSSSDESKVEDDRKLKSAQIFIQPPVNCNGANSDIDSGDENLADGDASVLSGTQLLGCAVLEINPIPAKVLWSQFSPRRG